MGDISRHRDIFLNTREIIPTELLDKCKLKKADLTYLEMGNYLTDVSQFRDPVMFIFSKQRIWREFILPKVGDQTGAPKAIAALAGAAGLLTGELLKRLTSGIPSDIGKYGGPTLASLGGLLAALPNDLIAGIIGADDWTDKMFGTPIEKTIGDLKKRDEKHYGYIGQFFQCFIEGITHLIFAADFTHKVKGEWGRIDRISATRVTEVFSEFFTQYYPHEHTDQPPYIWDASQRPNNKMYQPSSRQRSLKDPDIGVMNAVDDHYVQYLSEGLADLEQDWKRLKPADEGGRQRMLVRMGKLLHGIEDWYFHSNVVELYRMRIHTPGRLESESTEEFLTRFVKETASKDGEFLTAQPDERLRLQRRLYRRLRYPVYERGNAIQSGGILSKTKPSISALNHAYPAFPSQQDTAHTLMHALENLERQTHPHRKSHGTTSIDTLPPWVPCVLQKFTAAKGSEGQKLLDEKAKARGVNKLSLLADLTSSGGPKNDNVRLVINDVLREWIPLILTLLNESERQRLVANIDPMKWPLNGDLTMKPEKGKKKDFESDEQLKKHKNALKPKLHYDGVTENNYDRLVGYLVDCGFLNNAGKDALKKAFAVDFKSDNLLADAPGAGGFLIKFSLELQSQLDAGDKAVEELNKDKDSVFNQTSDNSAFNEIVGSHSLMSKDTLESPPFFNEAKVFASLASSSVFHIMLEQLSGPKQGKRLPWKAVLHYFIRFPSAHGGWERRAMAFYNDPENKEKKLPSYQDFPEIANLVENALQSKEAEIPWKKGKKDDEMKERYIELEAKLSRYRYPQ